MRSFGFKVFSQILYSEISFAHKSNGINRDALNAWPFEFNQSVVFDKIILDHWWYFGFPWNHFSQKNDSEHCFKKRHPPTWKHYPVNMSGNSHRDPLACTVLKQKTKDRAQNDDWIYPPIAFSQNIFQKWCLNSVPSQTFQTMFGGDEKGSMSRARYAWSDTPLVKSWRIILLKINT